MIDGQAFGTGSAVDDRQAVWGEIDQARPIARSTDPVEVRDERGQSCECRVDERTVDGGFRRGIRYQLGGQRRTVTQLFDDATCIQMKLDVLAERQRTWEPIAQPVEVDERNTMCRPWR